MLVNLYINNYYYIQKTIMSLLNSIPNAVFSNIISSFLALEEILQLSQASKDHHDLTKNIVQKTKKELSLKIITFFHKNSHNESTISLDCYFNTNFKILYIKKLFEFFIPQLFDYIKDNNIDALSLDVDQYDMNAATHMLNTSKILDLIIELINYNTTLKNCNIGYFEDLRNTYNSQQMELIVQKHPTLKRLELGNLFHTKYPFMITTFIKNYDGSVKWMF